MARTLSALYRRHCKFSGCSSIIPKHDCLRLKTPELNLQQSGLNPKLPSIDRYERALSLASASRLVVLVIWAPGA